MDRDLIDKHGVGLSGRAIIQNFEIKPTDGTTLFVYLGKSGKFQIDFCMGVKRIEPRFTGWEFRVLTTTLSSSDV